jgi:glucokinase
MAQDKWFVGIDLGGTKIGTGLVDSRGAVKASDYRPTKAVKGRDAVIQRIVEATHKVMREAGIAPSDVSGIGIGAPGPLDIAKGILTEPPNLPGWRDVPLKEIIEDAIGISTYLENDANAAAIAEYLYGAGKGTRDMIYVTVSTGIGGGLILNGQIYHGAHGGAGEVGHMTILPDGPLDGCGNRGCLEALASGTAIALAGRELVEHGVPTLIAELAGGDPEGISAKIVVEAMHKGDAYATEIVSSAMRYLGIGMANLVNLFNPEMIVIGGGLSHLGDLLLGPVRRGIDRHAFQTHARQVVVTLAQLGDRVGIVGAAGAAMVASRQA